MAKRPKQDRPILWFKARDGRRRTWRFMLTRPDISPDLGVDAEGIEDYGNTNFERRIVWVNANKPKSTWSGTTLHELGHVWFDGTGLENKCEIFVEVGAVHGLPLLASLGFRFPAPPRLPWARRLRRQK